MAMKQNLFPLGNTVIGGEDLAWTIQVALPHML